ncbi:hypothetical protein ACIBHX_30385 [Nonomuraea sp. NPDC050536]|uniref:hypothetical protein n=1 Tax=Nonomuraea sp. NPDC050536 TaxID=3364366 RepID=UPI0037CC61D9
MIDHEVLDRRLDDVAKTLTGAIAGVAGLLAIFGIANDRALVAFNNQSTAMTLAFMGAIIATICSVTAFFTPATKRGNLLEGTLLGTGMALYLLGLVLGVMTVASEAMGNGRPTLTMVKLDAAQRNDMTLSFTVRADGVRQEDHVAWTVQALAKNAKGTLDVLDNMTLAYLRPNDRGAIEQTVVVPFRPPANATHIAILTWHEHRSESGQRPPQCQDITSKQGPGCVTIHLPS